MHASMMKIVPRPGLVVRYDVDEVVGSASYIVLVVSCDVKSVRYLITRLDRAGLDGSDIHSIPTGAWDEFFELCYISVV